MRNFIFITLIVLLLQIFSFPVIASESANINNNLNEVENVLNEAGENELVLAEDLIDDESNNVDAAENLLGEEVDEAEDVPLVDDDAVEEEEAADEQAVAEEEGEVGKESAEEEVPFKAPKLQTNSAGTEEVTIDLDKVAEPSSKYAEWEITLTIEGEATQKDSDIVLVFDRSNSMYESRLLKAKNAAKAFVDNLLVEGSTTRIALVPFGTNADPHTDFKGYEGRQQLKDAIDAIKVTGGNDGGTNIQAGLHSAHNLLNGSSAHKKTIVLLSDGAPTYSYRAGNASSYSWPDNKYNFRLHNFDYNRRIGNGSAYNLPSGFLGFGGDRYTVNGYRVTTNGIATISEAQNIIDTGIDIYSIGLEVGNDQNAIYTLENSQNKGYYAGGDDDMGPIFDELSTKLSSIASESYVIDPIGEKFKLVMDGSYNGNHFDPSHGTVSWDEQTETLRWDIGEIQQDVTYTLTYKVTIDWDENPEGNVLYPTNKPTDLHYKDHENQDQVKAFPIPEVKLETGKVLKKGYRVNSAGEPIDSSGNVVSSPAEAERLYDDLHGEDLPFNQSYEVVPKDVPEYVHLVGDNPTTVNLEASNPLETVWFGYAKETDLVGGDITIKHVDEEGSLLEPVEVLTGNIGDSYTTDQKNFPGYVFKEMDPNSAPASGEFSHEEQTVIYVYEKLLGSIKIIKTDENGERLAGATFLLENEDGSVSREMTTDSSGEIVFEDLGWGEYTVTETKAPEGYRLKLKPLSFTIDAENLSDEVTVVNEAIDWEIPETGGIGTLGFYGTGIILIVLGFWLVHRRRKSI